MSGAEQIGPAPAPEQREDDSAAASKAAQTCADANSAEKPAAATSNPVLEKYEQCWRGVEEKPSDFTMWTTLIAAAEKLDEIERIRKVFDGFFKYYPLCYGYWKKYADAEARHGQGDPSQCLNVFERGVSATPFSTDLWGHYAVYKKSIAASPDDVRSVFERGLSFGSTDYLSHGLWDKYLSYEEEQQMKTNIRELLCRAIKCPLKELNKYMTRLRELAKSASVPDLMSDDDAAAMRKALASQAAASAGADSGSSKQGADATAEEAGGDTEAGAECPPGEEGISAEEAAAQVGDAEVVAHWLSEQEKVYQSTKAELEQLTPFLTPLKRPYFHVKPLDSTQLSTWLKYMDFMETRGDVEACKIVYERCLVPCASYPEFWERYVTWLESCGQMEAAEAAVQRMTSVFCRSQPEAHIFAARFDERRGAVEAARERYKLLLLEVAPRLLSAIVAAANFERRQGHRDAACGHFETFLYEERAKEVPDGALVPFMSLQYATFLRQAYQDVEKGRQVIDAALAEFPASKLLWEGAAYFEESIGGKEAISRALQLLERGSSSSADSSVTSSQTAEKDLSVADREDLSARAVDLATQYGTAEELSAAERRHFERFTLPGVATSSSETGRKRQLECGPESGAGAFKVARGRHTDTAPSLKAQQGAGAAAVYNAAAAGAPWPGAVPGGYPASAAGAAQAGAAGAYYNAAAAAYQYPGYGVSGAYPYAGQYGSYATAPASTPNM